MDEERLMGRLVEAVENVAEALEELVVLQEHALGVRIAHSPEGHGPYIPKSSGDED